VSSRKSTTNKNKKVKVEEIKEPEQPEESEEIKRERLEKLMLSKNLPKLTEKKRGWNAPTDK
jgi:hypothetical protein